MFCCTLLYALSSIAITLTGKRELVALLNLSSWCLVIVERLFLAVPRGCPRFVIMVFPDHTHLLFYIIHCKRVCNGIVLQMAHFYSKPMIVKKPPPPKILPNDTMESLVNV